MMKGVEMVVDGCDALLLVVMIVVVVVVVIMMMDEMNMLWCCYWVGRWLSRC